MGKSNTAIYAALIANLLIAAVKFMAGAVSNSSAMISEGIHSLVDTVNELLLLWGIRQSEKPEDISHPFGYGRELFFWSFIVAMLIFGLGGGISIYQGITHILRPEPTGDPFWNYIVLAASIIFEGASLMIAVRSFNKLRNGRGWWQFIRNSTNPSEFMVLFEDGAAVIGLIIVISCVWLNHRFGLPYLEGVASLLVGVLLVAVSSLLARESRSLLMGEGILKETKQKIITLTEADPSVIQVRRQFSIYVGPARVMLMMDIKMDESLHTSEIREAIGRIRNNIQQVCPQIKHLIIQPE